MEYGASPNLHQEPTEAPWGWLWSLSAASALLHNPSSCSSTPALHRLGSISQGTGSNPPTPVVGQELCTYLCCRGPKPRREDMKIKLLHFKKTPPQQKRSCCQLPRGESSTSESRTGLVTKTEAAPQVMNPGHPLERKPIPVKTQPTPAKTPVVWSTSEFCVPWKIPTQH